MTKKLETCPVCNQSDKTLKVSQVYLESISGKSLIDEKNKKNLRNIMGESSMTPFSGKFSNEFTRAFTPPSGEKQIIRSVHPDQVMVVLTFAAIFFLYNIAAQQPGIFWFAGIIYVIVLFIYILARKSILKKYQTQKDEIQTNSEKVADSIKVWMGLYYCARDKVIYNPVKGDYFPISGLKEYLSKKG